MEGGLATRDVGQIPRGISIQRTTYSVVGQSRTTEQPIMWLAPDTPVTSVYVPFYPAAGESHAEAYSIGVLSKFDMKSAFWAHDFVSNWASLQNWKNASGQFVLPLRAQLHNEIEQEMPAIEAKARKEGSHVLADWQKKTQQRVVDRWWQLATDLIVAYNDGFYNDVKTNTMGLSLGYPKWWAESIGMNQDVHPIFVKRDADPQATCARAPSSCAPDFKGPASPLPGFYDFGGSTWLMSKVPLSTSLVSILPSSMPACALQLLIMCAMLVIGIVLGA
jgi:hypothetical protein